MITHGQDNPYLPDDYGYQVLIEEGDVDRVLELPELQCKLVDVMWEGASMRDGFYYAIYLSILNRLGGSVTLQDSDNFPSGLKVRVYLPLNPLTLNDS